MHWKAHLFRHFRLFQTFSLRHSHTPAPCRWENLEYHFDKLWQPVEVVEESCMKWPCFEFGMVQITNFYTSRLFQLQWEQCECSSFLAAISHLVKGSNCISFFGCILWVTFSAVNILKHMQQYAHFLKDRIVNKKCFIHLRDTVDSH